MSCRAILLAISVIVPGISPEKRPHFPRLPRQWTDQRGYHPELRCLSLRRSGREYGGGRPERIGVRLDGVLDRLRVTAAQRNHDWNIVRLRSSKHSPIALAQTIVSQ